MKSTSQRNIFDLPLYKLFIRLKLYLRNEVLPIVNTAINLSLSLFVCLSDSHTHTHTLLVYAAFILTSEFVAASLWNWNFKGSFTSSLCFEARTFCDVTGIYFLKPFDFKGQCGYFANF